MAETGGETIHLPALKWRSWAGSVWGMAPEQSSGLGGGNAMALTALAARRGDCL
jgi:hypothetical protein